MFEFMLKLMKERTDILPHMVRVSTGTATVLGLQSGRLDSVPTTAYLMSYHEGKCVANCGFCPQARASLSNADKLSRVTWPAFPTTSVIERLEKVAREGIIMRICIQALNYPGVFDDISSFVKALKAAISLPISVSCQPLTVGNLWLLEDAGVDRIGIALDAATETLFDQVKGVSAGGQYRWRDEWMLLRVAVGVFGEKIDLTLVKSIRISKNLPSQSTLTK